MKRILEHRLALLRAAVLTASLFGLSGCVAAIAPLLSLGGAVTAAPAVQVAATAFSVGEYCYEYSENDRNPVEVVEYKLAKVSDFLDGEETEVPQAEAPVMLAEAGQPLPADRAERVKRRIELRRLQVRSVQAREVAFNRAVQDKIQLKWTPKRGVDLSRGADGDVTLR
ncbi:hypothetical protein [Salidesulfovibrio brasiliensis]